MLFPRLRWRDLSIDEALALDLEQAQRWQWQLLEFAWLNFGIGLFARVKSWRRGQ